MNVAWVVVGRIENDNNPVTSPSTRVYLYSILDTLVNLYHPSQRGQFRFLVLAERKKNVVLAVGNCGIYTGPWGVRVEDTVAVGAEGPEVLTVYPRNLARMAEPDNATEIGMLADRRDLNARPELLENMT
jgi:hypothetical protein